MLAGAPGDDFLDRDQHPLKAIQDILGHSTITMTMRYAHLAPEVAREAVRMLDGVEGRFENEAK